MKRSNMTECFTSMLLAGLLISNIERIQSLRTYVDIICRYAESLMSKHLITFRKIADMDFDCVLFLGSGPLLGCAIDSHLKLQEMTNGMVVCKYDSYLGLRHGPKVMINSRTLIVALLSNRFHVNCYEMDPLNDICRLPSAKTLILGILIGS